MRPPVCAVVFEHLGLSSVLSTFFQFHHHQISKLLGNWASQMFLLPLTVLRSSELVLNHRCSETRGPGCSLSRSGCLESVWLWIVCICVCWGRGHSVHLSVQGGRSERRRLEMRMQEMSDDVRTPVFLSKRWAFPSCQGWLTWSHQIIFGICTNVMHNSTAFLKKRVVVKYTSHTICHLNHF